MIRIILLLLMLAVLHFVGLDNAFRLLDAADTLLHEAYERSAPRLEHAPGGRHSHGR
jgi:hypothetical protein